MLASKNCQRYSNSTVFSPATVRLIPIIVAPAACVFCAFLWLIRLPDVAVSILNAYKHDLFRKAVALFKI